MTLSYVDKASGAETISGADSITITVPAGAQTGDLLVAVFASGEFASDVVPADAAWQTIIPGRLFTLIHDDSDNSHTFDFADSLDGNPVAWALLVIHTTTAFADPPISFSAFGADTAGYEIGPSVEALTNQLLLHLGYTIGEEGAS